MLKLLSCIVVFLVPIAAAAQCIGEGIEPRLTAEDRAELDARIADTPYGQGLFWKATRGQATLYLIGTMHLPDPRHHLLVDRASPLLEASNILLVEATLEDQIAMQQFMAGNPDMLTLPTDMSLPELMGEEDWAAVRRAAQDRGIPGFMAAKMQPWFLSMSMAVPPCASMALAQGQMGLDGQLLTRATEIGLPVASLEAWEDMFDMLRAGTMDEQLEALRMGLIDLDAQTAVMNSLITAYFDEDTARGWHVGFFIADFVPKVSRDEFETLMADLEQDLLVARNHAWMPVIEDAAASYQTVALAFGAAHLIGDDGIPNLLVRSGWTLERLQ